MSGYGYAAGNPIKFVDVNGDSLFIHSQEMTVAYVPGTEYQGDNEFIALTWLALDFISANFDDEGFIEDLAESESFDLDVIKGFAMDIPLEQGGGKAEYYFQTRPTSFAGGDALTHWTPNMAWNFGEGMRSPVENFYHELVHAANLKSDRKAVRERQLSEIDGPLKNEEEKLVILKYENRAAERMMKTGGWPFRLFGGKRLCHKCRRSEYFKSRGPFSIIQSTN